MNISQSIKKIYPELEFDKDFIVFYNSDGKGQQIKWLNKKVKQPTKAQLEKAWVEVEKEIKAEKIDKETRETIFAKYSDNKQRTLLMKAMSGDTTEFQAMTTFVIGELAKGQAKKDKL